MTRGSSLIADLYSILNNQRYSDIQIKCSKGQIVYASRYILASRSDYFNKLLYDGILEKEISLPEITTSTMKSVLEYIYTGEICCETTLTTSNAINILHAANHLLLPDLENNIFEFVKKSLKGKDDLIAAAELLDAITTSKTGDDNWDNRLGAFVVEFIAKYFIESIPFNKMTIGMLQYILSFRDKISGRFTSSEYDLLRYLILWAANQVSPQALSVYEILVPGWPFLSGLSPDFSSVNASKEEIHDNTPKGFNAYSESVIEILTPILPHIDLLSIGFEPLAAIVQPLQIFPPDRLLDAYHFHALAGLAHRESLFFVWDKSAKGSGLRLDENDCVVYAPPNVIRHQSIRSANVLTGQRYFEWDVIIEESCDYAWVGICAFEGVDYSAFLGSQKSGWVFGSGGTYYNAHARTNTDVFGKGAVITVHLDMIQRNCAFSINGNRKPVEFTNLPDKVYPAVSLASPGRFRIQPHSV